MSPRAFLQTLMDTLSRHAMWQAGDTVLVGVSGGADSMALLYGLVDLQARHGADLAVAHLNHGLRPEAEEEAHFVAEQAARLQLPFHCQKTDLEKEYRGCGLEEAGRMARYAFFRTLRTRHGYARIATAHHADDRIEQILMNLIRGCGPDGLEGIPAIREDGIVRPLIAVHRPQILAYLEEKGLRWKEDPSNRDPRFLRNRIRHTLLPLLEREFNPAIRRALLNTGDIAERENTWFQASVLEKWPVLFISRHDHPPSLRIDAQKLSAHPPAFQARFLRHAIERLTGSTRSLTRLHIESLRDLLRQTEARQRHLPGKLQARVYSGILEIRQLPHGLRQDTMGTPDFHLLLSPGSGMPQDLDLPHGFGRVLLRSTPPPENAPGLHQVIPHERFPLFLRSPCPGDRMRPQGRGGSRKIFKLLAEAGIPAHLRQRRPVFTSAGQILWMPGLPPDEALFTSPLFGTGLWLSWIPPEDEETSRSFTKAP